MDRDSPPCPPALEILRPCYSPDERPIVKLGAAMDHSEAILRWMKRSSSGGGPRIRNHVQDQVMGVQSDLHQDSEGAKGLGWPQWEPPDLFLWGHPHMDSGPSHMMVKVTGPSIWWRLSNMSSIRGGMAELEPLEVELENIGINAFLDALPGSARRSGCMW